MYLVKIENDEAITYPIPEQNARDCEPHFHGQMITPQLAEMYGYGVYEFGVEPPTDKYKRVERDVITRREDAIWVQQYVIRDATDDEKAKEDELQSLFIREQRDWRVSRDIDSLNPIRWGLLTSEKQTEMTVYRQALLDIPQQDGFPWDIEWPTCP